MRFSAKITIHDSFKRNQFLEQLHNFNIFPAIFANWIHINLYDTTIDEVNHVFDCYDEFGLTDEKNKMEFQMES